MPSSRSSRAAGAVKFVKDYARCGPARPDPSLWVRLPHRRHDRGTGRRGRNGVRTTLHYADDLDNPANVAFLKAFRDKTGKVGDIYSVQGWDAASLIDVGLKRRRRLVRPGGRGRGDARCEAQQPARPLSFNKAGNPIQNIYLREVRDGRNAMVEIAEASVDDPARGCRSGA